MFYTDEISKNETHRFLTKHAQSYQAFIDEKNFGDGVICAMNDYFDSKLAEHRSSESFVYDPEFSAYLDLLTEIIVSKEVYEHFFKVNSTQYNNAIKVVLRDYFHCIPRR